MDDLPTLGTVVADRYRLLELLGKGGAGAVFLVDDEKAGIVRVIKIARSGGWIATNVLREFEVLARIDHPGVVRACDAGLLDSAHAFVVLERVDGRTVAELCDSSRPSVAAAITAGVALAEALDAVHGAGYLHRDVKPQNVVVPTEGNEPCWPRLRLIDFGVSAELVQSSLTSVLGIRPGIVSGTPDYVAPEQALGAVQTTATDIYGLGGVLHLMLYNTAPANGTLVTFHIPRLHRRVRVPMDRVFGGPVIPDVPEVPARLRTLMTRLLARDPTARPQTAMSVADQLRVLGADQARL